MKISLNRRTGRYPRRESPAQLLTADRPLWRADLSDRGNPSLGRYPGRYPCHDLGIATEAEEERRALLHFLQYQRDSVIAIVDGLSEEAWHTPVVPSGWTPAGLVEHLGGAERHWFQQVVKGSEDDLPWDDGLPAYDPEAAFTCDRPSADILAYYREQCARSDAVLAGVSVSAAPAGRTTTLRWRTRSPACARSSCT